MVIYSYPYSFKTNMEDSPDVVDDVTNITGIAQLLDYHGSEDLNELEKSIINGSVDKQTSKSEVEQFKDHLNRLGSIIGAPNIHGDVVNDKHVESESETDDNDDVVSGDGGGVDDDDDHYSVISDRKPMSGKNAFESGTYHKATEEQKKQNILSSVIKDMHHSNDAFQIEREIESDDKCMLLEDIDTLMVNMKDMGVDLSRIPPVNSNSSMADIKNIHKILRIKNDRTRYCDLAEDSILGFAHVVEWAFDGKKEYLGRKPDLTGWHTTVNIKLRRMRYHTSTFVSDMMQTYDISHGTRIMLELLPSLFTHTNIRKRQHGDTLIGSDRMNDAMNTIRDIDEENN